MFTSNHNFCSYFYVTIMETTLDSLTVSYFVRLIVTIVSILLIYNISNDHDPELFR